MNKTALFLCSAVAAAALPAVAHGQWSDNFDTYNLVDPLPNQSTWEAWGNNMPGAGQFFATDERSISSPNSVVCNGGDDAVHQYFGYTTGAWAYTAWQFIPNNPGTGSTYFILCNTYDGGGPLNNWSTQVAMDPTLMTVASEFEGDSLPLQTGSWVEIRVVIDLINDSQQIYYDGDLLSDKSWTEGVSGGGALNIGCVDLWANNTAWSVYYDDLSLESVPLEGACCLEDGSCLDNTTPADCATYPNSSYQGHGTSCANVDCPVYGPCGWIITAPGFRAGDTCGAGNDCGLRPSQDETFEVFLPYASDWTFSLCGAGWDTYLYVGTSCCGMEVGFNDDGPTGCAPASELTVPGLAAGTYFVTVEAFSLSDCGPFTLVVSSPCEAPCDPAGIQEPEPICQDNVPDTVNVGCNGDPGGQVFTDIACGDIYCGTSGNFVNAGVNTRDMDWYLFDVTEDTIIHWIAIGEFDVRLWVGDMSLGCDNLTILTSADGDPCEEVDVPRVLTPGTYTVIISTQDYTGWDCGVEYEARLTCDPIGGSCPEDINNDDVVNVLDLLLVLAAWDNTGGPEDINGDGIVNVLDLLMVLAAWGPCP